MLPLSLKLVKEAGFTIAQVLKLFSYNPSKIIGLNRGDLKIGATADLVLIDLKREWEFGEQTSFSKCLNSPFIGQKMLGKAVLTIVDGVIVFNAL
jgi:dihydroorotase